MSKRTDRIRSVALSLGALLVIVLIVEIALRVTHIAGAAPSTVRPDPVLGWRYQPNAHYRLRLENPKAVSGRINSHGWRDRERTVEKPTATLRVAVLGDSYVEGFQVERDSTFTAIAERHLNDPAEMSRLAWRGAQSVEVLNFGRASMTQTEELLVLRDEALAYDPDLVALFVFPQNDIEDVAEATANNPLRPFFIDDHGELELDISFSGTGAYRIKCVVAWLERHSALATLVFTRLRAARRAHGGEITEIPPVLRLCTDHPVPPFPANYSLNKRLMAEMARLCRSRGVRFVVFVIPLTREEDELYHSLDESYRPAFFANDLMSWSGSVPNLTVVPLRPALRAQNEPVYWYHWNYAGHRVVGNVLNDVVMEQLDGAGGEAAVEGTAGVANDDGSQMKGPPEPGEPAGNSQ